MLVGDREVPFQLSSGLTCHQAAPVLADIGGWGPWWAFDYRLVAPDSAGEDRLVLRDTVVDSLEGQLVLLVWYIGANTQN